ncbi:MAG: nicotinate-nucleotide adenylyltransferase [bacterium]
MAKIKKNNIPGINEARKPAGKTGIFRLGIMGGTFDPIHYGHLLAAEQARCKFDLHRVVFVPSGEPPHKNRRAAAPAEYRYLTTVLATARNPFFSVSRTEIDREGPSYTIDTLRYFMDHYKDRNPRIFFITGIDAIMEIISWSKPDEILKLSTIIAATRPGYDTEKLKDVIGPKIYKKVELLHASALAISSTDIRYRVANGLPIKYLLPETVEQFIIKHRLYQNLSQKAKRIHG